MQGPDGRAKRDGGEIVTPSGRGHRENGKLPKFLVERLGRDRVVQLGGYRVSSKSNTDQPFPETTSTRGIEA